MDDEEDVEEDSVADTETERSSPVSGPALPTRVELVDSVVVGV